MESDSDAESAPTIGTKHNVQVASGICTSMQMLGPDRVVAVLGAVALAQPDHLTAVADAEMDEHETSERLAPSCE